MRRHRATAWLMGLVTLAGSAAVAAPPTAPRDVPPPVLTRSETDRRDWTLRFDLWLHGIPRQSLPDDFVFDDPGFRLASVNIMFPRIGSSAMHDTHRDGTSGFLNRGTLLADDEPAVAEGYQGPTELLIWTAQDVNALYLHLHVDQQVTSYETRIDEARALEVEWPGDDHVWTPDLAANLEGQLHVRPDHPSIQKLLAAWTNNRPRNAKPYFLAKFLAGRVVEHVRVTSEQYHSEARVVDALTARAVTIATPFVSGFRVNGSVHAAERGQGSPFDPACLLTALYRAAGIPARMVIGYDVIRSRELRAPVLRAWTEFYLYDERFERGEWIPVDIERQRAFSSKAPPIEQRWQYFGHNEDFDFVAPIAHHWAPPASVTLPGAPGFWGWVTEPKDALALQDVRFDIMETPMTIGPDGTQSRVVP